MRNKLINLSKKFKKKRIKNENMNKKEMRKKKTISEIKRDVIYMNASNRWEYPRFKLSWFKKK